MKNIPFNFKLITLGCLFAALAGCVSGCIGQQVPLTVVKVNPSTGEVSTSNPKDTTIEDFDASVETNGTKHVKFTKLTTVMNPQVITETGKAATSEITVTGEAAVNLGNALGTALGAGVGTAAKTAK